MTTPSPTPYRCVVVQRGDDRPITFPATSGGEALDVTGWKVTATVWRREHSGADVLHAWSTEDGTAVAEGPAVMLLVDDSRTWTFERGYFEVELAHPEGSGTVQARGAIVVEGHRS